MEELSSILVNGHPECTILHAKIQKFSGGNTPGPPWREGATPSLHPPPARPSAVRGGALRPRLRGPSLLLILLESLPPNFKTLSTPLTVMHDFKFPVVH